MRVDLDLGAPPGWRVHEAPATGVGLALTGPVPTPSGLPPTITVGIEHPHVPDVGELCDTQRAEACSLLEDATVQEEGLVMLTGRQAAYLRLVHTLDGHALSAELWTWLDDRLAWTVTATVDRDQWGEYSALFEQVADSCRRRT